MTDAKEHLLLGVAEALADGIPVDWEGLGEGDPEFAHALGSLRRVEEMATAFRAVREAAAENDPPGGFPPAERP